MTRSDAVLWQRWQDARDADSLAEIFSRHSGMVYNTCRRILRNAADAEDAAQESFLDLMRAGGRLHSSLAAWLHTIAVRRSLDLLKRDQRRREREREAPAPWSPRADDPRRRAPPRLRQADGER